MDFFDANTVAPKQGGGAHPPGMFDATISSTYGKPTSNMQNGMLVIEFTTSAGVMVNRYNIWNASPTAVEIAQNELSALCHATGVFRITFPKDAAGNPDLPNLARELRGSTLRIEVAPQLDKERKETGYMEIKKVYDKNGNEPGKAPVNQPQQSGANTGWNTVQTQANPQAAVNPPQTWGQPAQSQPSQEQPQQQGWGNQPAGQSAPASNPPWGSRN